MRSRSSSKSGEFDAVARRHAEYYLDLFERAEAEAETRPTDEWLADYGPQIDNVRAALDWAFSPAGDASIGVALTAAAVPLWMHLSLMEECRGRVERALAAIAAGAGRDTRREMQLHAALAQSLMYSRGAVSEIAASRDKGARDCGEPRRRRVPVALALGPVVLSHQQPASIASLSPWLKGSMLWRRSGPIRSIA